MDLPIFAHLECIPNLYSPLELAQEINEVNEEKFLSISMSIKLGALGMMPKFKLLLLVALCISTVAYLLARPVGYDLAIILADKGVPSWTYAASIKMRDDTSGKASSEEAIKFLSIAANEGHVAAQRELGIALWFGVWGKFSLSPNPSKAMALMLAAAKRDDVHAQVLISNFYDEGTELIPADKEKSFEWALAAVEKGSSLGQRIVAQKYEEGSGTPRNYEQAMYWYKKSAEQGDKISQKHLAEVAPKNN